MLSLDDQRWNTLLGGRRVRYDPRPALTMLQSGSNVTRVWGELWDELHHQGDVDGASYASVPHLVRIYKERPTANWNIYAIVATIELAREGNKNPEVPAWLGDSYFQAIQELATIGSKEILQSSGPELVSSILAVLALARGARTRARFLLNYSEDELDDMERIWFERG
ncbi:MAG: hypothetical protein WB543_19080 [Candidatus Acidiferrum sp.]